jgi:HPt (histidine-containing phosphotransfer) domain-containing protein
VEVLDRAFLLQNVDDDQELLVEVLSLFRQSAPDIIDGIRSATHSQDADALHRGAHQLRGALANLGAKAASAAAERLERIGSRREMATAPKAFASLEREMEKLETELEKLLSSPR